MANNWLTRIKETLRKNLGLKVLALGFSIVSFYAVRSTNSDEATFEVPVEVKVERGVAVMAQDPMTVEVTFRGAKEDIENLDRDEIKAVINPKATDREQSDERIPIGPGNLEGVSARVRATRVRPDTVMLTFDREAIREMRIAKPTTTGTPLRGVVEIDEYEPSSVVIYGFNRGLKGIEEVDTEPVSVEGRVQSFTTHVRVLPPANTWVSKIEPGEIMVKVKITTKLEEREWENVPVLAILEPGSARQDVVFEPEVVNVTVKGRPEIVQAIPTNGVKVLASCVGLDPLLTNAVPATAHLSAGTDVTATVKPETVKVVFRKE